MTGMTVIGLAALAAVFGMLAYVAQADLRFARIPNKAVVVLLALWLVLAALEGFADIGSALVAGGILLALGFCAWLMKVVGAGDAKLLLAAGLLLGFGGLLPFSMALVGSTLLFVIALAAARMAPFMLPPAAAVRLDGMIHSRKIPAAVPIALALAVCLPTRYGWVFGG